MAKSATPKQLAAQNRLAAAAHQAKREGITGKNFAKRVGEILRGAGGRIRSAGSRAGTAMKSSGGGGGGGKGLGAWMRRIRMGADVTGPGVGVFLDPNNKDPIRQKASDAFQRYAAVGLDGSINVDKAFSSGAGILTAVVDDKIKVARHHYQLISQKHILPAFGEGIPYLYAWDAIGQEGKTARQRIQAAHDCFVETTSGYVPSSGEYRGLSSDKLKSYLVGSHVGREGSRLVSRIAPKVQAFLRDLTGGWGA